MIRIILNVEVGNLTELKINKLSSILSGYFPNGVVSSEQISVNDMNSQMVISSNSIQYIMNNGYDDRICHILSQIFDLLMIDFNCSNSIVLETDIININIDMMNLTKEKFTNLINDAIGIGTRSFFKYDNNISEIRVEPYLSDSNNVYIEAQYNLNSFNINNIDSVIKLVEVDYNIKKDTIIKNL